ncbi:unnamed protein product [Lactuca saligna]|uniref:DUF4283 domain-containing protein n=1 Tax=Lactuca saligna TaxID=75948 RepID=A0AA36EHK2_LACSI|nr:unnamed protein product [Lactuca saligna]
MIKNLCDVWFGYHKMFAYVPRTPKKDLNFHREPPKVEKKRENLSVSYANVVSGGHSEKSFSEKEDSTIVLDYGNFVIDNKKLVYLAMFRDFSTLPNLRMLCHDEGFDNFIIRYVGGLWVMFKFKSKEACKNFLTCDAVNHWISEKRTWDKNFVTSDRIVWVAVEGLPLRAWSKNSFRHILAKWGSIAHLDDNIGEHMYKSRKIEKPNLHSPPHVVVSISTPSEHHVPNNYDLVHPLSQLEVPTAATHVATVLTTSYAIKIAPAAPAVVPDAIRQPCLLICLLFLEKIVKLIRIQGGNNDVFIEDFPSKVRVHSKPVGFSGGFGRVSGINCSEDDLSHLTVGESLGYNMDGCMDRVI